MSTPETAPPPDGRHYPNAPIAEAILDIRVSLPGETPLDQLSQVNAETADAFPTQREAIAVTGQFTVGPQVSSSTTQSRNGYVFVSEDERSVFQARLDGFSFSRLAPYEDWSSFRAAAHRQWSAYRTELDPTTIDRVALRYVNRINLPLPFDDF